MHAYFTIQLEQLISASLNAHWGDEKVTGWGGGEGQEAEEEEKEECGEAWEGGRMGREAEAGTIMWEVMSSNAKVTFLKIEIFFIKSGQMVFSRLTSI